MNCVIIFHERQAAAREGVDLFICWLLNSLKTFPSEEEGLHVGDLICFTPIWDHCEVFTAKSALNVVLQQCVCSYIPMTCSVSTFNYTTSNESDGPLRLG